MVFKSKRNKNMEIQVKTGTEGPHQDPYHYEEITIKKDGQTIMLKEGIESYIIYTDSSGSKVKINILLDRMFKYLTGYTIKEIKRIIHNLKNPSKCRKCGSKRFMYMEGYVGEDITICENNHVVNYSFNKAAII